MKGKKLGNPLVVASAVEASKTDAGQKAIKDTTNAIKIGVLVAGSIFLARYGYSQYKKFRARKYAKENGHKPEVQAAVMLHSAMFSGTLDILGFEFTIPDGTDETVLNNLALQIDLKQVSDAYKILFDRTLLFDVQNELTGSELQVFFNRLKTQGADVQTPAESIQPYLVGETLWCRNKSGLVLKRADIDSGKIEVSDESKGKYAYGEEIGKVVKVFKAENNEVFYVIDRSWKPDGSFGFMNYGYGYANHRDLINKNPDIN